MPVAHASLVVKLPVLVKYEKEAHMNGTEQGSTMTKGTVVTGVVGHDIHIIGIRIIERALRNSGLCRSVTPVTISFQE